jgi:TrmH family RNA methyltransferase
MEKPWLNNIFIIIVEPHHAGNIGSICRACKNMGIPNVVLVNPQVNYLDDDTFRLAWASHDVVHSIQVVNSLEDILPQMNLVIGTTQRPREDHPPLFSPKDLIPKMVGTAVSGFKVALVFGRENNGLHAEELAQCHVLSSIPTQTTRPAINLAQAVMIYAYELFQANADKKNVYKWTLAKSKHIEKMYEVLNDTVNVLPIDTRKGSAAFVNLFKRVLNRTQLEERDVRLFLKLFRLIQYK